VKIQVLHLDPHDDQVSVRDKLAWSRAPHVVLVWPDRGRVLTRRLDLVMLARAARSNARRIGVVAQEAEVIDNARRLGIPTFDSVDDLPEDAWPAAPVGPPSPPARPAPWERPERPPRPEPALRSRRESILRRHLPFAVGVAAMLALAAFLAPAAEVRLSPVARLRQLDITVRLNPLLSEVTPAGDIPARQLVISLSGAHRVPATGSAPHPATRARGLVTLTNLSAERVGLPAGTGVRASQFPGVRFLTLEAADLPARRGAQVVVPIEASVAGSAGNLPSGAIDSLEGPAGLQVRVSNPQPTAGGGEEMSLAVSTADLLRVRKELTERLLQQADTELRSSLPEGEALAPPSLRVVRTVRESFDAAQGDSAESVGLELTLEIGALAYRPADIRAAAHRSLAGARPPGFVPFPESTAVRTVSEWRGDPRGDISARVRASEQVYDPLDEGLLRLALRGKTRSRALAVLSSISRWSRPPQITTFPSWLPWLPWLERRIEIRWAWDAP
jgi:hypothetical protein